MSTHSSSTEPVAGVSTTGKLRPVAAHRAAAPPCHLALSSLSLISWILMAFFPSHSSTMNYGNFSVLFLRQERKKQLPLQRRYRRLSRPTLVLEGSRGPGWGGGLGNVVVAKAFPKCHLTPQTSAVAVLCPNNYARKSH